MLPYNNTSDSGMPNFGKNQIVDKICYSSTSCFLKYILIENILKLFYFIFDIVY